VATVANSLELAVRGRAKICPNY